MPHPKQALQRKFLCGKRAYAQLAFVCLLPAWTNLAMGAELTPSQPPQVATSALSTNGVGPKIQFAAPVYDFGRVPAGEVVKHEFAFTNVGDRRLEIRDVRTSCGCTTAGVWPRQLDPGVGGTIPIELRTLSFNGLLAKTVTVTSNDTNQPVAVLQLKGTVWRPVDVTPQSAVLNYLVDAASNVSTVVRIVSNLEEPLTLSEPESNQRALAAELKTVHPGKEYQLLIKVVPPLGPGNVFGRISLKTSSPKTPLLEIPVYAIAQRTVTVAPAQLVLPPLPITNIVASAVSIRSLWTNSLELSEPTFTAKGVDIRLNELQPGRLFTVTLIFPQGFHIAQGEKAELTLKSNHPQYPVISVPVFQTARPTPAPVPSRSPMPRPAAVPPLPPQPPSQSR
jgi:hypothetical protein